MIGWAARRLVWLAATFAAILLASFLLLRLAPGGPFDAERSVPPEVEAALRRHYGLDLPLVWNQAVAVERGLAEGFRQTQIGRWSGGLLRGDLGPSFQYRGRRVQEVIAAGAPASATVGLLALELAVVFGIALGAVSASRAGGRVDLAIQALASLGLAVPSYVTAVALAASFGLGLRLLPLGGWGRPSQLVMPAIALAAPHVAVIARLTRSSLLEVLSADFIRTARAKGLGPIRVLLGHALRPALAPVVQYLGPAAASLVTGSLAVEAIFHIPGLGAHFVNAALNRDYTLVMGTVVVYAGLLLPLNALSDGVAVWLDPRSRDV